jgi:hypothetical protein
VFDVASKEEKPSGVSLNPLKTVLSNNKLEMMNQVYGNEDKGNTIFNEVSYWTADGVSFKEKQQLKLAYNLPYFKDCNDCDYSATLYFKISVLDKDGNYKEELLLRNVQVTNDQVLSTQNESVDVPFLIYPNPVKEFLNIFTKVAGTSVIYDINGKELKVFTINEGDNRISVSGFSKGIYIIKTIGKNFKESVKIVIE